MAIVEVNGKDHCHLQSIADTIALAKKIVVCTGAGISTNCGIPDFRSEDGLYASIRARSGPPQSKPTKPLLKSKEPAKRPLPINIKGKELFDSLLWKDPANTAVFYQFIASLRKSIHENVKRTSATHRFIRTLRDCRKLVRCYTQNIDGLEEREGLRTDLEYGKGSRSRFTKKALDSPKGPFSRQFGGRTDAGCEVIQLHGDLMTLRCTLCQQVCKWHVCHNPRFLAGRAPLCQNCLTTDSIRQAQGKRGTKVGTLRPNIILYGEEHPSADAIGSITSNDLTMAPDLLLILGTSLHVHGLKTLVREFAKSVHARPGGKGKVVFINISRPAESMWKDVIDYWVCMDCDEWVAKTKESRPDIWQVQEELSLSIKKRPVKPLKRQSLKAHHEEDKENIIFDSQISPSWSSPQPKVVITTPKKPRLPLIEWNSYGAIPFRFPQSPSSLRIIPDSDPQSSLPTPPSSGGGENSAKKRKRLAETYSDGRSTPSKQQKLNLAIWEN